MDISQMSEEEQLQAAMQLSLQESCSPAPAPPSAATAEAAARPRPGGPKARTFHGKDQQDRLLPPCRGSAKKKRGEGGGCAGGSEPSQEALAGTELRLEGDEVADLLRLLFGDSPELLDMQRWLGVGFQWSRRPGCEWGLWQKVGGPCGVFAPLQGFIVKHLLFEAAGADAAGEAQEPAQSAAASRKEQPLAAAGIDDEDGRALVLAHALSSVLFQCTPTSSYVVCQVLPKATAEAGGQDGIVSEEACAAAASGLATGGGSGALSLRARRVSRASEVRQLLEEAADSWLAGPCGVLSFLVSVLLTRTVSTVREDMDDASNPLIGRFGHCSQELVNLMIIGEATSNVFDGTRWLGDDPSTGFQLKGVDSDRVGVPQVGLLSELEPMRYLSVGMLYKHPDFPIWVLGSPTHYTLVFSARRADSQLSEEAQLEQQAKKVFVDNSLDEGGLAMASNLEKMLQAMSVDSSKLGEAQSEMVREDIILWDDFRRYICKHFGVVDGKAAEVANQKLQFFLYDGQDPPGPSLKSVRVELSDIDPALAGGGSDGDPFVATLHTRWPNAVVLVEDMPAPRTKA